MEKKSFPKEPDWNKVEQVVMGVTEDFKQMTFTEKRNVVLILQSMIDREYNVTTVIQWLEGLREEEEFRNLEKVKGMNQYS